MKNGIINQTESGQSVLEFMKLVNSRDMLELFVKSGALTEEEVSRGYDEAVIDMCNNGVAYVLSMMIRQLSGEILKHVNVVEGRYGRYEHTWISLGDDANIVIDPTLAQFDKSVPDIAIVDISKNENYEYEESGVIPAVEWVAALKLEVDVQEDKDATVENLSDRGEKKDFNYDIGSGSYSFSHEISGLECFMFILEEMDRDTDDELTNASTTAERDNIEEAKLGYDFAIKEIQDILSKREFIAAQK